MLEVDIGKRVTAGRLASNLTVEQLAVAAGIHSHTLRAIEHGKTNPSIGTLSAIAAALKLELIDLITDSPRRRRA